MKIKCLDNALINKIAAGEVIERPASVVKELVENSIDAGAKNISVEIKNGGVSLIRVSDDGSGIAYDDIETAFVRHATSKISCFDDLSSVLTLGFRGEALASIASVSEVSVTTKTEDDDMGCLMEINYGQSVKKERKGCANGTVFEVRNLFSNVPVRRKFLKKTATETGYITDIIEKTALVNTAVSIKYTVDGIVKFKTSACNDIRTSFMYIFGRTNATMTTILNYSKKGFALRGIIGKPEYTRGNRNFEMFFVNGRYVKSDIIQNASEDAYKGRIMIGRFPVFALDMTVPANNVDVNVHPAKREVRFADDDFVYNFVKSAILSVLEEKAFVPEVALTDDDKKTKQIIEENLIDDTVKSEYIFEAPVEEKKRVFGSKDRSKLEESILEDNFEKTFNDYIESVPDENKIREERARNNLKRLMQQAYSDNHLENVTFDTGESERKERKELKVGETAYSLPSLPPRSTPEYKDNLIDFYDVKAYDKNLFRDYTIVGQIFNTYWLIEKGSSLFMLDQHAMHEKVLFERLKKDMESKQAKSQRILLPVAVKLNEAQIQVIEDNKDLFENSGFEIEKISNDTIAVNAVPYIFDEPASPSFFVELADALLDKNLESIYDTKYDLMATISCKSAVKGNHRLSYSEAKELIDTFMKLDNPFNCPHGRPTIVEITKTELEKKFKRIQH